MFLLNAFSLNMLDTSVGHEVSISVKEVDITTARLAALHGAQSAVGHAPTAAIFEQQLGYPIAAARATVKLKMGDAALIGQYSGPRLEEGATVLPPGATIKWLIVRINQHYDAGGNIYPPDDDDAEVF